MAKMTYLGPPRPRGAAANNFPGLRSAPRVLSSRLLLRLDGFLESQTSPHNQCDRAAWLPGPVPCSGHVIVFCPPPRCRRFDVATAGFKPSTVYGVHLGRFD